MANKEKFEVKQVIDALEKSGGFVSIASKMLGCTRKTIYNYIDKYALVREKLDDINCIYDDAVEAKLIERAREGSTKEMIWYMTHKESFRKRGYSKKTEVDVTSKDEKIQINIMPFEED